MAPPGALREVDPNVLASRRPAKLAAKPVWAATVSPPPKASAEVEEAAADQLADRLQKTSLASGSQDANTPEPASTDVASAKLEEGEAEEEQPAALAPEDSCASTATASVGGASQLGSPLAAFAAAKARLARTNSDADSLISNTLQALAGMRQGVAAAAAARNSAAAAADAPASSALTRLQQERALEVVGGMGGGAAMAALQKRNAVLKERLQSTVALCRSLHAQNQESLEMAAELRQDNQRLSDSLHKAQLDKASLQQTIRELKEEAALLAQQAKRALLAGGEPARAAPEAGAAAPAAPARPAQAAGEAGHPGGAAAAVAAAVPPAAAAATFEQGLSLVRDWSSVASSCSSASSGQGASWQPGTSIRSFQWVGSGSSSASAATYARGGGAASDKRRRLAPGMLAHCLRPSVAAAVAEAAAMDAGYAAVGLAGRTPKRKHRQLSSSATATSVAPAGAAAPDAATPSRAPPAHRAQGMVLAGDSPVASQEWTAGVASDGRSSCVALAAPAGAPDESQGQRQYTTFDLFDSKWYGNGSDVVESKHAQTRALLPASNGSITRRRSDSICSIM